MEEPIQTLRQVTPSPVSVVEEEEDIIVSTPGTPTLIVAVNFEPRSGQRTASTHPAWLCSRCRQQCGSRTEFRRHLNTHPDKLRGLDVVWGRLCSQCPKCYLDDDLGRDQKTRSRALCLLPPGLAPLHAGGVDRVLHARGGRPGTSLWHSGLTPIHSPLFRVWVNHLESRSIPAGGPVPSCC